MAHVYLALKTGPSRFNKLVVLKLLRQDLETPPEELVTMFLDEARLAACLNHKNIVQTHEFGEAQGHYFMAMEYLEGRTLRETQRKAASVPVVDQLFVLAETARGLHHAHELLDFQGAPLSVVHRDVSPQNVFITYDGRVKLLDFGIAKVAGADHMTRVGVIKGKINYIAPEQVRGDALDRRADVFALGAMLWEAITGQLFAGGVKVPEVTKFHNRLTGKEAKVRDVRPDVPEELARIVDDALALNPMDRMASAAEFADRLEAFLAAHSYRPSEESLAMLMRATFQEEREEQRKLVEVQCRRILEDVVPITGMTRLDLSYVPGTGLDLSSPGTGSSHREVIPAVSLAATGLRVRRPAHALAALGLVLAGALAFAFRTEPSLPSTSAQEVSPVAVQQASPQPAASQPVRVQAVEAIGEPVDSSKLVVRVTPRYAVARLDGLALPQLPFSGSFPHSDVMHRLEVSAPGFQTVRRFIRLDHDQEFSISLTPSRPAARPKRIEVTRSVEAEAPRAPAQAPPAVARPKRVAPGARLEIGTRTRNFDMQDPYAD